MFYIVGEGTGIEYLSYDHVVFEGKKLDLTCRSAAA
jgi:hypothetical protein